LANALGRIDNDYHHAKATKKTNSTEKNKKDITNNKKLGDSGNKENKPNNASTPVGRASNPSVAKPSR
jgi:hypothetical protein